MSGSARVSGKLSSSARRTANRARRRVGRALRQAGGVTRSDLGRLVDAFEAALRQQTARVDWLGERTDALEEREAAQVRDVEDLKRLFSIEAMSRWIRHTSLMTAPLVSVALPTRDRLRHLERAIDSVRAQRYENWELLVIDDGGSDDSSAVVEAAGDARISWSRIPNGGVGAARNAALKAARGEIVAYLDDDNVMDPDWLYAVVWGFEQRPDVDVLYGAFVIDDMLRVTGESSGALPWTFLNPWSRDALCEHNLADISAIAHRAGLAGAWFDEDLGEVEDWDLLVRLTAEKDPLVLPAVACYYTTDAPGRITKGPTLEQNRATVMARAQSCR